MNVAQALIQAFAQEGVRVAAGMGGGSTEELADAAYLHSDIRICYGRNERSMVDVADGYGRVTGKPAIIFCDAGPAAANCMAGIVNSHGDSTPMIFIAPAHHRLTLQYRAYKEMPLQAVYGPVTKWTGHIYDPREIGQVVRKIFTLLRSGRPSPIVVEVPSDVAATELDSFQYQPLPAERLRVGADPVAVERAVRLLAEAKRPLLYAGGGVLLSEASAELVELAELLTLPVATTLAGKSGFPDDHPLCLGIGGFPRARYSSRHATRRATEADVILAVGCSFQLEACLGEFPNDFKLIQIDVDANEIHKKRPADVPVLGDAKLVLRQMVESARAILPKARLEPDREVLGAVALDRQEWMDFCMPVLTSQEHPINPFRVTWEINKLVDSRETIVLHDSGSTRGSVSQHFVASTPRSFLGFGVQSAMGWTLGAAMGAKLAAPEKLVVAFVGEEAFGETAMELETAVRHRLPILWVLMNNSVPRESVKVSHPARTDRYSLTGNYVAVAKGLGCQAWRVEDPAELASGLRRAIDTVKEGATAVLEVKTQRFNPRLWA